jgi:probable rRNA maturation factor
MPDNSTIVVEVANAHPTTRLRREPIAEAVRAALRGEKVRSAAVGVVLVSDEELLEMNRRFLDHDYYTDVITFSIEPKPLEGEIYISVDRAREQAAEHGVGLYDEVRRLAIHGALHLAGYDDATDEERERMRRREDRYLTRPGSA